MIYCDTCSLVKLYTPEIYSEWARQTLMAEDLIVTCRITLPEIMSALTRSFNRKEITEDWFQDAQQQVWQDWRSFYMIEVEEFAAAHLVIKYGLRGFDATHLGSVLSWQYDTGLSLSFCSFDKKLLKVAESEGLPILVPDDFQF